MALLAWLAKPMAVTIPCALLLLDVWPIGMPLRARVFLQRVAEKAELFALSLVGSVLTIWAQQRLFPHQGTWQERIGDAAYAILAYLSEFALPLALSPSHPRVDERPEPWVAALSVGIVVVITGAALGLVRRAAPIAVGWLWFIGVLFPTLGIMRVGQMLYSDRYTYVPSVGLVLMVAASAAHLPARLRHGAVVVCAVVLGLWAVATARLVPVWASPETLTLHALEHGPLDAPTRHALGLAAYRQGRLDVALAFAEDSERVRPSADTADFWGQALARAGRLDEAQAAFTRALTRDPKHMWANLHLGELLRAQGHHAQALVHLERAVEQERSRRTLDALAQGLHAVGRHEEAQRLETEAKLLPEDPLQFGPYGAFPDPYPGSAPPTSSPTTPSSDAPAGADRP